MKAWTGVCTCFDVKVRKWTVASYIGFDVSSESYIIIHNDAKVVYSFTTRITSFADFKHILLSGWRDNIITAHLLRCLPSIRPIIRYLQFASYHKAILFF